MLYSAESLTPCTAGGENWKKIKAFWRDQYSKNNQLATGVTFCSDWSRGGTGVATMGLCEGSCSAVKGHTLDLAWTGHVRSNKYLEISDVHG